jgi:hypothetical protein
VQALESSQVEPFGFAGLEHIPVAGLQAPALWHWSSAEHWTVFDPAQAPDWQASIWVHWSPSLHAVPSAFGIARHCPLPGSQAASLQAFAAEHTLGLEPTQAPYWQTSESVQKFESSHTDPFGLGGFEHRPEAGSQMPAPWHWSNATH